MTADTPRAVSQDAWPTAAARRPPVTEAATITADHAQVAAG
jgi:hypothetical protein